MSHVERVVTYTLTGSGDAPIEADFEELRAHVTHDGLEVDESTWDFEQETMEEFSIGYPSATVTTSRTVTVSALPKVLSL